MTREKYESLPLSMLKALAKSRNMKGISTLRKEALIERMLEEDQKENQKNMEEPAVLKEEKKTETVQDQNQEPQEKREDGMERQNRETSENGTARPYQRPRYVRREERSENGERQEYRPRAPRFNERRFQEPRNYNQNNREEEQRQEPRQEAGQEMRQDQRRDRNRVRKPARSTAARRPAASSRSCRTDLDLSAPTTICRATAMSTFLRPKSAVSD